jgi:uncharacterized protein (TIGR02246 family)
VILLAAAGIQAQKADDEAALKKLAAEFEQAWAKGDAKALAAMHAPEAIRVTGENEVFSGRDAIQGFFSQALAGMWKGSTLAITPGEMRRIAADVYVGTGRYQITGGNPPAGAPASGRFINSYVREGGRWMVASSAIITTPVK